MKVRIEAGGRQVEIRELADKALEVWTGTEGASSSEGPTASLRNGSRDRDPSSTIRRHPGVPE